MGWKAPADFGGMVVPGIGAIDLDANGLVDTSELRPEQITALFDVLPSHGFTSVAEEAQATDDPNAQPTDVPDFNPATADVDLMTRNQLFAYLKAKGVAVTIPISKAALRDLARAADASTAQA